MHVLVLAMLAITVLVTSWSTLGFCRARNAYARFHFLSPLSTYGMLALAIAVAAAGLGGGAAIKAALVFAITAVTSPVTQTQLARGLWVRQNGGWKLPGDAS